VSRDFRLLVFFLESVSTQAPEYTIRAVSNFFENWRRYLQLKVHHRCCWLRWQMQKIFNHKSFNYLVWTPLGSRVNYWIHFCLQVHFKAWYCSQYLPPVQIWRRCHWYRWQIPTGVVDTSGAPWLANISANFRKNLKRSYWDTLGRGGNWFMQKTRSKNFCDTVPLKVPTHEIFVTELFTLSDPIVGDLGTEAIIHFWRFLCWYSAKII